MTENTGGNTMLRTYRITTTDGNETRTAVFMAEDDVSAKKAALVAHRDRFELPAQVQIHVTRTDYPVPA